MSDVIKHLDLSSADGAQLNMDALYQIMPSAFTRCAMRRRARSLAR
jgi:adenine-specific DNA-methyltransferase